MPLGDMAPLQLRPRETFAGTNPPLKGNLDGASLCPPEFIQPEKGILRDPGRGGVGALPGTGVPVLASRALKLMKYVLFILM